MSFRGILNLDHKHYNVLKLSYTLTQRVDIIGRPTSVAKGGIIHLTVETSNETDLLEWMISPSMIKSGDLVFEDRATEGKAMRTMYFNDAFCINYHEAFDSVNSQPMITDLTISARLLHFGSGNLQLENDWPGEYADGTAENAPASESSQADDGDVGNPSSMY